MKKFVLTLALFFLVSVGTFAQQERTAILDNGTEQFVYTYTQNFRNITYDTVANFRTQTAYAFNVVIHDISNSRLNECDYLSGIDYLNSKFNQFNIFFKYIGVDYTGIVQSEALNIYLTGNSGGAGIGPERIEIGSICFDVDSPFVHRSTIPHEFGHIFGINHTFTGTSSRLNSLTNSVYCNTYQDYHERAYFPVFSSFSENVTRDPNDPNYNATTTGDQITDTPAMQRHTNTCGYGSDLVFFYIPEVVDAVGDPYIDPGNVGVRNIMSYSPSNSRDSFTIGQGVRMREIFPQNPSMQPYIKDTSILYQPYYSEIEVNMDNNNIISIEDDRNNPGYMIVCRPMSLVHKFQKGFTYQIYKINSGYYSKGDIVDPADVTLINRITPDDCSPIIEGGLLAVKIPEISNDIIVFEDLPGVRGSSCSSEQITTTRIYTTNDLSNSNGTIKILDENESANPELIEELENQKYHNIKKTTETGVTKQKTIYKE